MVEGILFIIISTILFALSIFLVIKDIKNNENQIDKVDLLIESLIFLNSLSLFILGVSKL